MYFLHTQAYADEPASLECINKSDLFPKKTLVSEDASLQVPFPLLSGEAVEYLGRTSDGVIALSNFRLLTRCKDSFVNLPLGLVELVESRDIFYLHITCKDATVVRCSFTNNDSCQDWYKRISAKVAPHKQLNEFFAFPFYAWSLDKDTNPSDHDSCYQLCQRDDNVKYSFGKEVDRLKFDLKSTKAWRITYINEEFGVSPTYPKNHIVPSAISDEDLKSSASFRALRRFPSVVWRDQRNGAVLVRCSQPELGWFNWRNTEDEKLLAAVSEACNSNPGTYHKLSSLSEDSASSSESSSQNGDITDDRTQKKMFIMDCRSYGAAFANRVKGGGVECPEYYPSCEIQFMNLANIHTIRKSFIALRTLCSGGMDQASWLSALEKSNWLTFLGSILKSASIAVSAIDKEGRPVLVHCSDGWDRTSQIISLSELMLDPYYRTIEGFQVLVEREWLDFGHKFGDRCGNSINIDDVNERSPVFLQWLDCVFQLIKQFPCAFQFNEAYLIKLVQHTYSHLFGTFLCNSTQERLRAELEKHTASVWSLLHPSNKQFHNNLYSPTLEQQVLYPQSHVRSLVLWESVYLSNNSSSTSCEDPQQSPEKLQNGLETEQAGGNLQKTRSCENLLLASQEQVNAPGRRRSDPNIALDTFDPSALVKDGDKNSSINNIPAGSHKDASVQDSDSNDEKCVAVNGASNEACDENHVSDKCRTSCNGEIEVFQNGDSSEVEDSSNGVLQKVLSVKHSQHMCNGISKSGSSIHSDRTFKGNSSEHLVESSTDTVTEDDNHSSQKTAENGSRENGLVEKSPVAKFKTLENSSSISTSTSDISSSHVNIEHNMENLLKLKNMLYISPLQSYSVKGGSTGIRNSVQTKSGSYSPTMLYPTPNSSQTPNSTCPPTPGTDYRSSDTPIQQKLSGIGRHLDVDGLTTFTDPVQQRVLQIQRDYNHQIQLLKNHLAAANAALLQHASACSGGGRCVLDTDHFFPFLEMNANGDLHSIGSNAASDVSWEQVDESDAKLVRWVPDHAVTHCAECDQIFNIVIRKHHCRNCGNIFCHNCTDFYVPLPHQNLMSPERVCRKCYNLLPKPPYENGLIDERPLAAAASN
ncbi:hypothetical protein FSP39_006006 [Pinctada imbricata]|uniref:phosphatidylinositol-3,5-bisphosphate 3-phosphatase n=1 Tax=Pinctada imbricata TaxID=66713 RepID=A0AA88XGA3_PINIB|nr:hypothetical protein FSP39_006006 [Pinctada imbricata]